MAATAAGATTLAEMEWHDRVLLVAAPSGFDPALAEQRRILANWRVGAEARNLRLVTLAAGRVEGATDDPATLARVRNLPADRFIALLIGKDGHEVLREARPISAEVLRETIDAMPMRRDEMRDRR